MEFSDKVKFVRMKLELSQKALAEELGVTYATISRWENDNRTPQMATLGKFYNFCERRGIAFDNARELSRTPPAKGANSE